VTDCYICDGDVPPLSDPMFGQFAPPWPAPGAVVDGLVELVCAYA
jgi:hypothetical protein